MSSRYGRSVNAVHAPRIVMEERRLLGLGEIAGDRLETIEDRVEARSYAADREVAAEHRSIDAKAWMQ
jgi:hypothetical protein